MNTGPSTTRRLAHVAVVLLAGAGLLDPALSAQQRALTLEDLYHPERRIDIPAAHRTGREVVRWLSDSRYLEPTSPEDANGTTVVDAVTGARSPLFDAARLEEALAAGAEVTRPEAARLARQSAYTLNPDATGLLLTVHDDLFWWPFDATGVTRLTRAPGTEHDPAFSPDGRLVAYTRDHDLYVADLDGREQALTADGHERLLNGRLDWLYQEEIYGRGNWRAFWWSPDSTRLAYLQLDEARVPDFTITDHIPYRQDVEVMQYPKAGDPNPSVRLGVVRASGGPTIWADSERYAGLDLLVVNVGWTPDGAAVICQLQDREQTWLDLLLVPAATGQSRTLLRETTEAWVEPLGPPTWLPDGSFLWLSQRSGWTHLYRYRSDGTALGQVTSGEWDVRNLYGASFEGEVYFSATERSYIGQDVYRARLDGSALTRLSEAPGTHDATFNPGFTMYAGRWSDLTTPPQLRIHRADGSIIRAAGAGGTGVAATFAPVPAELLQVPTRDGFQMEAMLIRPSGFDPLRRYPVYQHTYGGPGAPQVRNAWAGRVHLFHQLLAQHGVAVWICDNRSASAKGARSAWPIYGRLGELELQDIEDGLAWLRGQPWVDDARIGLNGWSYGGFMTMYALTHSRSFAMGIAGGGVSDWRDYDTVYTERYMRLPERNAEGYRRSAPRWAADQLSGQLLLLHGLLDDNVHAQSTLQFAYELQRSGRLFELMLYPRSRHAIDDPNLIWHQRRLMFDFILRTLQATTGGAPVETPN